MIASDNRNKKPLSMCSSGDSVSFPQLEIVAGVSNYTCNEVLQKCWHFHHQNCQCDDWFWGLFWKRTFAKPSQNPFNANLKIWTSFEKIFFSSQYKGYTIILRRHKKSCHLLLQEFRAFKPLFCYQIQSGFCWLSLLLCAEDTIKVFLLRTTLFYSPEQQNMAKHWPQFGENLKIEYFFVVLKSRIASL